MISNHSYACARTIVKLFRYHLIRTIIGLFPEFLPKIRSYSGDLFKVWFVHRSTNHSNEFSRANFGARLFKIKQPRQAVLSILLKVTLSQQGNCSCPSTYTAVLPTGQGFHPPQSDIVTTRKLQQGHRHYYSTAHGTGLLSSLMRHCRNKETAAGPSPSLQYCPLDRDYILLAATLSQQGNRSRAIAISAVLSTGQGFYPP